MAHVVAMSLLYKQLALNREKVDTSGLQTSLNNLVENWKRNYVRVTPHILNLGLIQHGWPGRTPELTQSSFLLSSTRTGRTIHQIWANDGSKCVVPCKDVPFGAPNDAAINFGIKSPKNWKLCNTNLWVCHVW